MNKTNRKHISTMLLSLQFRNQVMREGIITSKKVSLYVIKLLLNHFSRSSNSFLDATAANLIL